MKDSSTQKSFRLSLHCVPNSSKQPLFMDRAQTSLIILTVLKSTTHVTDPQLVSSTAKTNILSSSFFTPELSMKLSFKTNRNSHFLTHLRGFYLKKHEICVQD